MNYIQKNIWLAFYIVFFLGVFLLSITLYTVYKNTYYDIQIEQENVVKISTNSVSSLLHQYELVLNILGKELMKDEIYKDPQKALHLIDNLNNIEETKTAYALIDAKGKVYVVESKNMHRLSNYPNLLDKVETKESFKKTLESENLVVGRTYYLKEGNKLIIPLRKAIRDKDKKVLFVASVVLIIKEGHTFLLHTKKDKSDYNTFIYRESDRYFQIAPKENLNDPYIYAYQLPNKLVNKNIEIIEKKYNMNYNRIKEKEMILHYENANINAPALLTTQYLKKYDLWVVVKTNLEKIMNSFYQTALFIVFIFILINTLIFLLFKKINDSEKKKQSILEYQASHDYLTNLHNRLFLDKNLKKLNKQKPFYLFFIDLDNFKTVNDSYGHEYGDKVLIEISRRLSFLKNDKDILVRYSGDEFLLLAYNISNNELDSFAKEILNELSKPYIVFQTNFQLTASIGISNYPKDGSSLDEIKRYADLALYESKNKKNIYTIFNETLKQKYIAHIDLEQKMKNAFDNHEFYMMYQPQVSNKEDIIGLEALVRWENKDIGFISPEIFIPVAESSEQMVKLGKYIISSSLKEIKNLENDLDTNINLSINISVKQFMSEGFMDFLLNEIKKIDFDKKKLQLEITESIFIEDVQYIIDILNKLRDENIKISLDDFGTGYSSLSLLNKLPIDELKIDKSFVEHILDKERSKTMIENIIAIAKKMDMTIVAEGIEVKEQKDILEKMGCNLYQGYYFSKPLKIDELKKFILKS